MAAYAAMTTTLTILKSAPSPSPSPSPSPCQAGGDAGEVSEKEVQEMLKAIEAANRAAGTAVTAHSTRLL